MKKKFLLKNLSNLEKCCNIASSNKRQKRIILSSLDDFSFIICIFVAELLVQYRTTNYMKHTTIIDIAKELGISKSTVSRALSGDTHNVKPETMRLINETAIRMGYQRNEMAVNLRRQSSRNIGIIIPEIVTSFFMNLKSAD